MRDCSNSSTEVSLRARDPGPRDLGYLTKALDYENHAAASSAQTQSLAKVALFGIGVFDRDVVIAIHDAPSTVYRHLSHVASDFFTYILLISNARRNKVYGLLDRVDEQTLDRRATSDYMKITATFVGNLKKPFLDTSIRLPIYREDPSHWIADRA